MTTVIHLGMAPMFAVRPVPLPEFNSVYANVVMAIERLPSESIGYFSLTLTNLVVGSAIRIELQASGAAVEVRTAASTTEVFSLPAYLSGNAGNDLRVKVRKASAAPLYKPYETLATALVGSSSAYIAQIPD